MSFRVTGARFVLVLVVVLVLDFGLRGAVGAFG